MKRIAIAQNTLEILKAGYYVDQNGDRVDLTQELTFSILLLQESLARSSALYKSLLKCPDYYDFHRAYHSLLYSDRTIYSPSCPVFKNDDGTLLEQPYFV
jgi:hypothetical protein